MNRLTLLLAVGLVLGTLPAAAKDKDGDGKQHWVAAWSTSPQGPYPIGFMVGQPLLSPLPYPAGFSTNNPPFAFPDNQARDQSLRMIVHPSIGGKEWRIRLSNNFGSKPVIIGRARVGIQESGGNLQPGTSLPVKFGGKDTVTIPVGKEIYSDSFRLDLDDREEGIRRALAVSLFVKGESGPMTYHAAAFTSSFLSGPGTGDHTGDTSDTAYPHSTSSWFFLDGVEVSAPRSTEVIVAFGDSITDGFFSTLNESDRWPDALQRRLRHAHGSKFSVVNEGIGGNMVTNAQRPPPGCTDCDGVPAGDRLERDVFGQAGVTWVIWLEGINDIGGADASGDQVIAEMKNIIGRVHDQGLCIVGATITPSTGTAFNDYGTATTDAERRKVNDFIRTSPMWDGVADFDAATEDPARPGYLLPIFNTNSTTGGMGYDNVSKNVVGGVSDFLHPNRAGFIAMAAAVDIAAFDKPCKWKKQGPNAP